MYSVGFIGVLLVCSMTGQSQEPVSLPAIYNNIPVNYVRTWEANAPLANSNILMNRTVKDVRKTTVYYDGLGRKLQTVLMNGSLQTDPNNPTSSANATDMVIPVVYDEIGREKYKYLSFPSIENTGEFKVNPFVQQSSFYNIYLSGQNGETNVGVNSLNWAYNKTDFDGSPLNRPLKAMSPGAGWVGSNRGISQDYSANHISESGVRIWTIESAPGSLPVSIAPYPTAELSRIATFDEHNNLVFNYIDKDSRTVLKSMQVGSDWMLTFYVYDDFGRLRCVIPPKAVGAISGNWLMTQTVMDELCFRYEYDERGRMIEKKVPGAGVVYMVYDPWDRLFLTQDGNQRPNNQYLITKYDVLNRPVVSGIYTYTGTITELRNLAKTSALYRYEERLASGGMGTGFTSRCWPEGNYEVLSSTYYDDYSWLASQGNPLPALYNSAYDIYFQTVTGNWPYAQANVQSLMLRGLVTGSKTRVLGTSTYLYSISFYDEKGRVIQTQSKNSTGGTDMQSTQYSWAGQPLVVVNRTEKAGTPFNINEAATFYLYDDLGRVSKISKTINSNINGTWINKPEQVIVQNEYNKLGQLKKKRLAPGYNNGAGLESLSFEYNIRGWMLGMNRDYAKDANSYNYFGFDLGYDKTNNGIIGNQTYNNAQYNGNIAGMVWKGKGDGEKRKYDFSYDAVNRLMKADFTQYTGGTFNQDAQVNYNIKMGDGVNPSSAYDLNGNILRMQQWGLKLGGSVQIDDMNYSYYTNTNKLLAVTEQGTGTTDHKLGDFTDKNTATTDYGYDLNGNLITDLNKGLNGATGNNVNTSGGLGAIRYNHLNLPTEIAVADKGMIYYTYDAEGNKLKKTVYETQGTNYTKTTETLYLGDLVYESRNIFTRVSPFSSWIPDEGNYTDKLQFIGHEEGRIRFVGPSVNTCIIQPARFSYDFFLKDHLGNVRSVITEQQEAICYIPATVEDNLYQTEDDIYNIIDSRRILKATTGATQGSFGNKLYRVHGGITNEKSGLGVTLKVMAGDYVKILAESYYTMPGGGAGPGTGTIALSELLTAFVGSGAVNTNHFGLSTSDVSSIGNNNTAITGFITGSVEGDNNARAFVNWILFDEQFKFVTGNADPVQAGGGYKMHTNFFNSPVQVSKSGYLYIYVSNESNLPVYFDNLTITHNPGPLMEETHYYPFGLTMATISSKTLSLGTIENKLRFNGKEEQRGELNDGTGLDNIDFGARHYSFQIGRWNSIDPLISKREWLSPYNFVQNNPILRNDPTGMLDGEYELTHDKEGKEVKKKVSDLGDTEGIDFIHNLDGEQKGNTQIVNTKTGVTNWISNGVKLISGYTKRDNTTTWNSIFSEWATESGPQNSMIFGRDQPMIVDIRTSNLYGEARNNYLEKQAFDFEGKITKGKELISFAKWYSGLRAVVLSGTNMTMQMLGSVNVSFYNIGNYQRLVVINDSKTLESFDRLGLNLSDILTKKPTRETRQTYIWIDNNIEE